MNRLRPFLFVLPALLVLALFAYWPLWLALQLSVQRTDGLRPGEFVGAQHFVDLLSDTLFWRSFIILGYIMVVAVPLQVIMPLITAKLMASLRNTSAAYVYRVLLVVPMIVPMIVTILVWKNIYAEDGALNRLLDVMGWDSVQRGWLSDSHTVVGAIIFMAMPFAGGVNLLIYLAGFLNIPPALREAMRIDGAGAWRQFWTLDLPLVQRQIQLVSILGIITALQTYENILVLTNGGPANSSLVPALLMFRNGFEFGRLGYASAIGCVLFALTMLLTLINMRLTRSNVEATGT